MSIPRNKDYPPDSVQCNRCGGFGCSVCGERGWLAPGSHPDGKRCYHCNAPLHPAHTAVYCSSQCAQDDATD